MAELKHAAFCGTRNIYEDMETAAKSLIAMSDVGRVHFFIEDDEFPRPLPEIIELHNASNQAYFSPLSPNMKSGYTYMAMMRAALCHELPDVDKVLSLDADIVCMDDVSAIWDMPIDDCYFSATHEWHRTRDGEIYCNTGVALYNLRKLRDGKADEIIAELNANVYPWLEQDLNNYRCQGSIHDMPSKYNSNYWTDKNADGALIVHFAGVSRDQWINDQRVMRWRHASWDEVMWLHAER